MLSKFLLLASALMIAVVVGSRQFVWSGDRPVIQIAQAVHDSSHAHGTPAVKSETKNTKKPASEPAKVKPAALQPAEGAKIKIIAPTKNQVFTGDKIPLQYSLTKGKRGHHAHAYVDGELMGMFESTTGTLNGIKPGKHVLELRVVASDHQTELDATDKVEFTVK